MNSSPHPSSLDLAQRLNVLATVCTVASASPKSASVREVVLNAPPALAGVAGNDLMIRVADGPESFVRRRYSVRGVDAGAQTITLWVVTTHDGPGSRWARHASPGDPVDVVGPRGKIPLSPLADWHLFMGDATGLGAFYRMAESIEAPGRAIFVVEIDGPDDAITHDFGEGLGVTGIFVDRAGRDGNDPEGLLRGLSALALPADRGHAYLFGEFKVTQVLRHALMDRGLEDDQISRKAFWRMGQRNLERGEPDKSEV